MERVFCLGEFLGDFWENWGGSGLGSILGRGVLRVTVPVRVVVLFTDPLVPVIVTV